VAETLQGLPGSEPPGRLTRPLKPQGFEVLSSLLQSSGKAGGKLADIVHFTPPKAKAPVAGTTHEDRAARDKAQKAREAALEKQAAAARAREAAKIETQLGGAQRAEREAEKALADGQNALARTERQHAQLQEELSATAERLDELTSDVKRLQQRADAAAIARKRLQDQLAGLRES
jgi:predicted  nucleic acid-binding Zn-ribbon protein